MENTNKPNKISEIVRLQLMLKKWKKRAKGNPPKVPTMSKSISSNNLNSSTSKSIKFLKKTLSFSDRDQNISNSNDSVPKGYLAVCVGKELKRFIIPMDYLSHQAFQFLLREAEEEFGFQQEGVLKIPCDVAIFEKIVKMVQEKRDDFILNENIGCYSPDQSSLEVNSMFQHPQMCR